MPVHRLRTGRDSVDPTTARVTFAERLETDNAAYRRAAAEARARQHAAGDVPAPGAEQHASARAAAASLRVPLGVALGDIPEAQSMAQPAARQPKQAARVQPVPIGSIIDLIA